MICFDEDDVEILKLRASGGLRDNIVTKSGKRGGSVSRSLDKWETVLGEDVLGFIEKAGASLRKTGTRGKFDLKTFPLGLEIAQTLQENDISAAEGLEYCKTSFKLCREDGGAPRECT